MYIRQGGQFSTGHLGHNAYISFACPRITSKKLCLLTGLASLRLFSTLKPNILHANAAEMQHVQIHVLDRSILAVSQFIRSNCMVTNNIRYKID